MPGAINLKRRIMGAKKKAYFSRSLPACSLERMKIQAAKKKDVHTNNFFSFREFQAGF